MEAVSRWEVTHDRTSSGERGEKEVRVGDEELDIGHVVTAGFREIRSIKKLAK